jgi:hypothetical protein
VRAAPADAYSDAALPEMQVHAGEKADALCESQGHSWLLSVSKGHHQITREVLSPSVFHSLLIGSAPG